MYRVIDKHDTVWRKETSKLIPAESASATDLLTKVRLVLDWRVIAPNFFEKLVIVMTMTLEPFVRDPLVTNSIDIIFLQDFLKIPKHQSFKKILLQKKTTPK